MARSVLKYRRYDKEFKQQAVQMMLDGQSAASVARNLGLPSPVADTPDRSNATYSNCRGG